MIKYLDDNTGLNNMLYLLENYGEYINKPKSVYAIIIDLCHLNDINESFGRNNGDICIITFSNLMKEKFSKSLLIRKNGNEFIIITGYSPESIEKRIEEIQREIIILSNKQKIPIEFAFNCGIAKCTEDIHETLYKAEITMLHAKRKKRIFEYYHERFLSKIKKREEFVQYIDNLIENNSFEYNVQHIYDIEGKNNILCEVFTRGDNDCSIFDDNKYAILETTYRLKKIDILNIETLLGQIMPKSKKTKKVMININFQTIVSCEYNFVELIKKIIEENDLNPKNICLCINTIEYSDSITKLVEKLLELKRLGIEIAIEKFNTGEKQYIIAIASVVDIDYVKFNKQVLVKAMNERKIKIVIKNIINMLIELDIQPIFVNIETTDEQKFIKELSDKCLIRGHLFAKETNIKNC